MQNLALTTLAALCLSACASFNNTPTLTGVAAIGGPLANAQITVIDSLGVKKSTKEDKEKIKEIMGDDAHMIDNMTPREMYDMLREARADIMLSGGRSQFVALKARMPWLDINQERFYAYAGYEGAVELVHQIDRAVSNPVWQQVRLPAPWGDDGDTLGAVPAVTPQPAAAQPIHFLADVAAHALGLAPEEIPA